MSLFSVVGSYVVDQNKFGEGVHRHFAFSQASEHAAVAAIGIVLYCYLFKLI